MLPLPVCTIQPIFLLLAMYLCSNEPPFFVFRYVDNSYVNSHFLRKTCFICKINIFICSILFMFAFIFMRFNIDIFIHVSYFNILFYIVIKKSFACLNYFVLLTQLFRFCVLHILSYLHHKTLDDSIINYGFILETFSSILYYKIRLLFSHFVFEL